MEAVGLTLSVAQTLFAALQCKELKDFLSVWGSESELESLERTVETIQAVLYDVDRKQAQGFELKKTELDFIEKLKDAVYDADDLLDEFATLAAQQEQLQNSKKVRRLLSRLQRFGATYRMSQELKNIRKKLDGIASDAHKYSFKVDYQPIKTRREETCSYVSEKDIIGRDEDKRNIIDMLLNSNVEGDFHVVAIVGMGGLGKTALAQLIYNDPKIQKEFPLRVWVCVSDQDQNEFDVEAILRKIYKSITKEAANIDGLGLDLLVLKLREKLKQDKYLLVLDDVWTEIHHDWLKLKPYLVELGQRGNKIVVTTRSERTATVVQSNHPYKLQGLSEENSWRLFENVVGKEQANCNIKLGKDIIKKCANVPLAIKVMGSLLYGQSVDKWEFLHQSRLNEIKDGNDIMPLLKISYYHLRPSLKSCFTYCALFPKDFKIKKEMLVSLGMAHDYVEPLDNGQTIEEAADEYFRILLRRCFFQDVEGSEVEGTLTFKIHDLMHDMAQEVAGEEILVADSTTNSLHKKVRHIYNRTGDDPSKGLINSSKVRTYIRYVEWCLGNCQFVESELLMNWRSLRALHLSSLYIESLPNAIGKLLLHLRYLDLSSSSFKMLPKSFTNLINLQYLNLDECRELKQLPNDFNKLIKLRTLYLCSDDKEGLRYMPLGMDKLSFLRKLHRFVVGERKSNLKQDGGRLALESIGALRNLKGHLQICVTEDYKHVKENDKKGEYLCNLQHLNSISITWVDEVVEIYGKGEHNREGVYYVEDLLEDLRPHSNIRELEIDRYVGIRIPSWARADNLTTFLPNLVKIVIKYCYNLQELPWLGKLPFLKTLELVELLDLEYMEEKTNERSSESDTTSNVENTESSFFFPSLQELDLSKLPKLKGWWKESDDETVNTNVQTSAGHPLPSFPSLSQLYIDNCPELTTIPLCPTVETLGLYCFNENLQIMKEEQDLRQREEGGSHRNDSKLRILEPDNVRYLNSMPMVAFQCLTEMRIHNDKKVESLSEVKEEVFRSCSSSLPSLLIRACTELRSVSGGLEYLTALESLRLLGLPELRFDEANEEEEESTGMPWKSLAKCLRYLELDKLDNVYNLPKGMRYLTALQSLKIRGLPLKDLPEWIGCLSSLHSLEIWECKHLESLPEALQNMTSLKRLELCNCTQILHERCKEKNGVYWPRIQHIHDIRNEFSNSGSQ